jgi:hypothetical protein
MAGVIPRKFARSRWGCRAPKGSAAKSHQQDELFAVNKVITALLARHKVASEGSVFRFS